MTGGSQDWCDQWVDSVVDLCEAGEGGKAYARFRGGLDTLSMHADGPPGHWDPELIDSLRDLVAEAAGVRP